MKVVLRNLGSTGWGLLALAQVACSSSSGLRVTVDAATDADGSWSDVLIADTRVFADTGHTDASWVNGDALIDARGEAGIADQECLVPATVELTGFGGGPIEFAAHIAFAPPHGCSLQRELGNSKDLVELLALGPRTSANRELSRRP